MDEDYSLYSDMLYDEYDGDYDSDSGALIDYDIYDEKLQYLWYEDIWKSELEKTTFTMKCTDQICACRSHIYGDVYICQQSVNPTIGIFNLFLSGQQL